MCKLFILLVILFNFIQDEVLYQNLSAEALAQDSGTYYAWHPRRLRFLRAGLTNQIAPFMQGGLKTKINKYPYLVSLREDANGKHFCGGSIVSRRHVVTAAQCFCGRNLRPANKFVVITGTDRIDQNDYDASSTYPVEKTVCHPEFMEVTSTHDIGLVITQKNFRFSDKTNEIDMVPGPYKNIPPIEPDLTVTLIGWGTDDSGVKDENSYLQILTSKTVSAADCKRLLQEGGFLPDIGYNKYEICTYNSEEKNCIGTNIGTPVVHEGKLLGVTDWSQCRRDVPDIHTSVKHHYAWIFHEIQQTTRRNGY